MKKRAKEEINEAIDQLFENPEKMGTLNQEPVSAKLKSQVWSKISSEMAAVTEKKGKTKAKIFHLGPKVYLPIAALLTLGISTVFILQNSSKTLGEKLTAGETIQFKGGQQKQISLAKGAITITLHKAAGLRFLQQEQNASITLQQGLALFKFSSNSALKTFRVITPHGSVKVTGTEFLVQASPFKVVLFEGKVKVTQGKTEKNLMPNQGFQNGQVLTISRKQMAKLAGLYAKSVQKSLTFSGLKAKQPKPKSQLKVILKDGSTVIGTLVKESKTEIVLRTEFKLDISIARKNIAKTLRP